MLPKKQEETDRDAQGGEQCLPACQVCGITVQPETAGWREDEGGGIYCRDCLAERESCGCSD